MFQIKVWMYRERIRCFPKDMELIRLEKVTLTWILSASSEQHMNPYINMEVGDAIRSSEMKPGRSSSGLIWLHLNIV